MASSSRRVTLQTAKQSTVFPLGQNIFATVKTWRGQVKIRIGHYTKPTNTKGGRLIPTQRKVSLDLTAFQRLMKARSKLIFEHRQQQAALSPCQPPADREENSDPLRPVVCQRELKN